jgi:hypothetical protein
MQGIYPQLDRAKDSDPSTRLRSLRMTAGRVRVDSDPSYTTILPRLTGSHTLAFVYTP